MLKGILYVVFILFFTTAVFGAHPLITDDTGTQGKGKLQLEVNSEYSSDKEKEDDVTIKENGVELAVNVSYGVTDTVDVVLGMPYQWIKTREDGDVTSDEDGTGDMSLELKWRFYEKDGMSFALKPGLTLPTGDEEKGLGNGKASYGLMLITTKEIGAWAFHLNLGYMRNEYKLSEDNEANRKDIWHASLATQVEVIKDVTAAGNIGIERNPDNTSNTHPAFILCGLIYSVSENFDVDLGIKAGLNKPETDLTLLAGLALRY